MEFIIKAIIGGIIIATVSTVSERYPTIGAFILGIPADYSGVPLFM